MRHPTVVPAEGRPGPSLLVRLQQTPVLRAIMGSLVLRNLVVMLLWVLVWQLSRLLEYTEHASVWFPVAGLTFAVLLLEGWRAVPGLAAGAVYITLWVGQVHVIPLATGDLFVAGCLFAVAHIGAYALGAFILRMFAGRSSGELPGLVLAFLLIAALSSLLSMILGISVLVASGMLSMAKVSSAWGVYWIGDLAGVLVMGPFFAACLSTLHPPTTRFGASFLPQYEAPTPGFKYKLLLILFLLAASMVPAYITRAPNSAFTIFFLVIPYMWIACTEPAFYNLAAMALGSLVIAVLVNAFELKDFVMVYQFAINVIAANALFGLALPTLIADNDKLRRVAETDSLTGAASRACLERNARHEIERYARTGEPLSVIVFDVDYFKKINDLFGHAMGDRALRQVSEIAQHCLRPSDLLGRVGGDEFVALLPGIAMDAALTIAERIRAQVHTTELEGALLMTASFGLAQMKPGENYEALFERADRALYLAKQQGRNRAATLAA